MGLQTGLPARNAGTQQVHFLRKRITFDGSGTNALPASAAFNIGTIPADSIILGPLSGVDVNTVFNAGTNNRLNIGISGTPAKYAATSSLLTAGFVPMAVAVGHRVTVDTTILVTPDVTGTAATTGDVDVVIAFIPYN